MCNIENERINQNVNNNNVGGKVLFEKTRLVFFSKKLYFEEDIFFLLTFLGIFL